MGRSATLVAACLLALASLATVSLGASSTVVVTMDVPSATLLTDNCDATAATDFGVVVPGTNALTATGADVCSVTFTSSNDSALLALGQKDGAGRAMGNMTMSSTYPHSTASSRSNRVDAYDADLVYVAGQNATLRRTMDGGATWGTVSSTTTSAIYDVTHAPADPDVWYSVGGASFVQKTTNGQAATPTWTNLTANLYAGGWPSSGPGRTPQAIGCASDLICWVVGEDGWIAKTTDGGANFTAFQHATIGTADWNDIAVIDASTAFLAAEGGFVARTTTGGANQAAWSATSLSGTWWYAIGAGSATAAYVAGNNGAVWVWNGVSWTNRSDEYQGGYFDADAVAVDPSDPATAWVAANDGYVRTTTDGGLTWTTVDTAAAVDFRGIDAPTSSTLYMSGWGRHVQKSSDGGASWTVSHQDADSATYFAVAADPTDGTNAVFLDGEGAITRTTDAGASLASVASPVTEPIFDAQFATANAGWAVGDQGTIIATTDGGATWTVQPSGTTARLNGVWAETATHAYAAGEGGTILRTTNGGTSWEQLTSGTTEYLQDIASVGTGTVIAVGRKGKLLRSTDGGDTFAQVAGLPYWAAPLENVVHAGGGVVYTINYNSGGGGDTWKSVDAGATWISLPNKSGINLAQLDVASDGHPWGAQYDDVRHSIDDWATTTSDSSAVSGSIEALEAIDATAAWAVGSGHVIVRYDASTTPSRVVEDYAGGTNDWASATTTSLFGWCLQAAGGAATVDAAWTVDGDGTCAAIDGPEWSAVPGPVQRVAYTGAAGESGQVDIVWGVRPKDDQRPGTYTASVVFDVRAPNA